MTESLSIKYIYVYKNIQPLNGFIIQVRQCKIMYVFISFTEKHTTNLFRIMSLIVHKHTYLKISTPQPLDHEHDIKLNQTNSQTNNNSTHQYSTDSQMKFYQLSGQNLTKKMYNLLLTLFIRLIKYNIFTTSLKNYSNYFLNRNREPSHVP